MSPANPLVDFASVWTNDVCRLILDRELARARRTKESTATMLVDLDPLEQEWGPTVREGVRMAIAGRLAGSIRKMDLVARMNDGKFLVILPGLGHFHAAEVASRLLRAVNCVPVPVGGLNIPATISLGASVITAGDSEPDELIGTLAEALASAEGLGRNRFVFYPSLEDTDPVGVKPHS